MPFARLKFCTDAGIRHDKMEIAAAIVCKILLPVDRRFLHINASDKLMQAYLKH
jgi:hypothetical protein